MHHIEESSHKQKLNILNTKSKNPYGNYKKQRLLTNPCPWNYTH